MPTITIENVTKRYGEVCALDSVSLSVEAGETFGLVGTNGAGKTTLFRLLAGHGRPDSGSISVAGLSPSAGRRLRRRVGYLPESAGFEPALTGREVLSFYARMRGVDEKRRERRVRRVLETVGLAAAADRRVGDYSNGMNRRLGLGTILIGEPRVLLLDEPTAGLDPSGVAAFDSIVERIREETEVTVVLSTHALEEVERLCDRAAILDRGRIRARGPVERLRRAGEGVTVSAVLTSGLGEAVAALRNHGSDTSVERDGERRISIRCPSSEAMDVLSTLHDVAAVDRFEVSEPGLSAAFRDAIERTGDDQTPVSLSGGESP